MRDLPAVIVAQEDGTVVAQNAEARKVMGPGVGQSCWNVVGGLPDATGLPCARGCVSPLVNGSLERAQSTPVEVAGRHHNLTCIPIRRIAVCLLSATSEQRPEAWELLTPREREVLQLLADGETTQEMSEGLKVSESTVRTHVENMRTKLGVPTRAALVALGFRLGFLD